MKTPESDVLVVSDCCCLGLDYKLYSSHFLVVVKVCVDHSSSAGSVCRPLEVFPSSPNLPIP